MPSWRAAAMKMWVRSWQTPRRQREGLRRRGRGMGRIGVEFHLAIERIHQSVQQRQLIAAGGRARAVGEVDNGGVGLRELGLAQEQAGREALDRAGDHALGVLGIDLALDRDRQFAKRPLGGKGMADIAEGVLVLVQQAILRQIDPPGDHILSVVIARGEAQHLDHAGGRRVVAISRRVRDANAHEPQAGQH